MSNASNSSEPSDGQRVPIPPPTWDELLGAVPSPKTLVEHLDRHVIGQRAAKKKLSIAVSNHYKRLVDGDRSTGRVVGPDPLEDAPDLLHVVIERSNVLLIGPSGSGKTLMVKALAEKLNVPVAIGDATCLTEAGYVGEDVESLLVKLYHASNYDLGAAQKGIVFIDEIDKLRKSHGTPGMYRDASGEGVQQALLKMIEGFVCNIPTSGGPKLPNGMLLPFDTSDVLFICGGAFDGLDDIISRRLGRDAGAFGFGGATIERQEDETDLLRHVMPQDLQAFGMIPELLGRLPVIATLDDLSVDDLERILGDPRDAILKQYRKLLRLQHGADLEFTPGAIREVARLAHGQGTGARGLRAVVERVVEDVMFEVGETDRGQVFVIEESVVRGEGVPGRRPIRLDPPLRALVKRRVVG